MPVVSRRVSNCCVPRPKPNKSARRRTLRLAISRLEREQRTKDSDRTARLAQFHREATRLDGDIRTAEATLARLANTIEQTRVRAPIAGRLGEVAALQPGAVVQPGRHPGRGAACGRSCGWWLTFCPAIALGRVQPGQPARLRLEGFPWAQYGSLAATVTSVANEARDGVIRVELHLGRNADSDSLQHGLPGTVEVEVERISPATLVLRAVGKPLRRVVHTKRLRGREPQGGAS